MCRTRIYFREYDRQKFNGGSVLVVLGILGVIATSSGHAAPQLDPAKTDRWCLQSTTQCGSSPETVCNSYGASFGHALATAQLHPTPSRDAYTCRVTSSHDLDLDLERTIIREPPAKADAVDTSLSDLLGSRSAPDVRCTTVPQCPSASAIVSELLASRPRTVNHQPCVYGRPSICGYLIYDAGEVVRTHERLPRYWVVQYSLPGSKRALFEIYDAVSMIER
jgi:hypothetical protein